MRIVFCDRSEDAPVPDAVREKLAHRLEQLGRHLDLLVEADVEFDVEARRSRRPVYVVDITLLTSGHHVPPVRSRQVGRGIQDVTDRAVATLDREVLKLKERIKTRN
jgi:ribosomal subunit interface protein